MNERGQHGSVESDDEPAEHDDERLTHEVTVRARESRPGRLVFTEDGNTDGWIATNLVLAPER